MKKWLSLALVAVLTGCLSFQRGEDEKSFRIVSYNIHHGETMRGKLEFDRVAWRIASEKPRFAGIQEVDQLTKRVEGFDTCAFLSRKTGLHATFAKGIDLQGGEYGNALLSREKPNSVRRIPLPGGEPRVLLLCEFDDCWVGVTHLAVDSEEARMGSVEIIKREVAACGAKPVFLMGDWNSKPDSVVLQGLRPFLTVVSDETKATYHGPKPTPAELANRNHCIDYIAVDSAHRGDYAVRGRRVVDDTVTSDHRPIVVEVEKLPSPKPEAAFTIATFNVRCPCDPGELRWYRRLPRCVQIIREHGFDVFGVQEATPGEKELLEMELPEFGLVGCGRNADRQGEGMYVFFRRDRFDCLDSGTFWLSETPDVPGSRHPTAACVRTCTWALLEDRVTGKRFRYFNTHLDHISHQARIDGLKVIFNNGLLDAKKRGETVFLTGDLNATLDDVDTPESLATIGGPVLEAAAAENPIAYASLELVDTIRVTETPHAGPFRTFHGFKGVPRCRIDYVFSTDNVRVLDHRTIDDRPEGQFASDHYPVAATVEIR